MSIRVQTLPTGEWVDVPQGRAVSVANNGVLNVLGKSYWAPGLSFTSAPAEPYKTRKIVKQFGAGAWVQFERGDDD